MATLSVIALNSARSKSRDAKRVADVKQISTALELFFNDAGRYPTDLEWATGSLEYNGQTYLTTIPSAPSPADGSCDGTTNTFSYTQDNSGESYTITFCTGGVVGSLAAGELCATPSGMAACGGGGGFSCGTAVSYGGESYPTVLIGTQCWFAKNLNVGDMVTGVTPQSDNAIVEKYCYNDDASNECATYGGLYQWDEAMQYSATEGAQGICPTGWHIPSDGEWTLLIDYLSIDGQGGSGDTDDVGGKLKEAGIIHWDQEVCDNGSLPIAICDSSSFTALPSGARINDGSFGDFGSGGYFWSSSAYIGIPSDAWFRYLASSLSMSFHTNNSKELGFSMRCLLD